jgi:hypothetical protein
MSRPTSHESGIALVATLASLIIVAILVAVVLSTTASTPTVTLSPGTTLDANAAAATRLAAEATCEANFEAVSGALNAYVAVHGKSPPAGTAWATAASGGPLLRAWPSQAGYAITWNGVALVVRPAHGAASVGSDGAARQHDGCFTEK